MRRLLLLRHAKAEPGFGADDFERSLTESGQNDARSMGAVIAERGLIPDFMLYSGARRTRETAEIVSARWPRAVEQRPENGLYDATRTRILALLRALPDAARTALVVGHNPGIGDIANYLTGSGKSEDRLRMGSKYPTSALAVIDLDIAGWADLAPRIGDLARFVAPVDLGLRG